MNKLKLGDGKSFAKVEEQDGLGCPFQTHFSPGIQGYLKRNKTKQVCGQALKFVGVCTYARKYLCTSLFIASPSSHSGTYSLLCTWLHRSSKMWAVPSRNLPYSVPSGAFVPWCRPLIITPPPSLVFLNNSWIKKQAF